MEPTERLARSCPRYKLGASLSRRRGRIGAAPEICTQRLILTKDAFRYQNLSGVLASRD